MGEHFAPYVMIGIAITVSVCLLVLFFYITLWGLLIGAILWLLAYARTYFFTKPVPKKNKGRIIEHDDP